MGRLENYDFGRVMVDGRQQTRELIVLPDRVVTNWWRREGHSLAVEDLAGESSMSAGLRRRCT